MSLGGHSPDGTPRGVRRGTGLDDREQHPNGRSPGASGLGTSAEALVISDRIVRLPCPNRDIQSLYSFRFSHPYPGHPWGPLGARPPGIICCLRGVLREGWDWGIGWGEGSRTPAPGGFPVSGPMERLRPDAGNHRRRLCRLAAAGLGHGRHGLHRTIRAKPTLFPVRGD